MMRCYVKLSSVVLAMENGASLEERPMGVESMSCCSTLTMGAQFGAIGVQKTIPSFYTSDLHIHLKVRKMFLYLGWNMGIDSSRQAVGVS